MMVASLPVKLKVCGITSIEDALAAIECGAEYLGFNFHPPSPRYIEPRAARLIAERLPAGIVTVGIFVNVPEPARVLGILDEAGVSMAQLHGDESPDYCREVGPGRVIKAVRPAPGAGPDGLMDYPAAALLLDAFDKNLYGGTGKTADWELAARIAARRRLFLAGGLSPENLAEAVARVRPFAVDVNSGVEISPGRKDHARLRILREVLEKI